jgi:CubicO group peptidase (beta-lactamase class C family)
MRLTPILLLTIALIPAAAVAQQATLPPQTLAAIDAAASQTLNLTGVPSASLAVVKDGQIVLERAYGLARIMPPMLATPATEYPIGSISKQLTASLILLLQQDGKLKLDDPVGRFLPELTGADKITIRQVLSHTAGYTDYWPEDYSPASLQKPTTPQAIVDDWARRKLDFAPGTQWQYSNTGYTIAGLIAEKAGGAPLFDQLSTRIFQPLHMTQVWNYDLRGLPPGISGYERYGFGPPRPAPLDRPGWPFGAFGLAMTPHDLALWDISLINRSVLSPQSYDALETSGKTANGVKTGYGLGIAVGSIGGHRYLKHSGEATGFVAENDVYPDDHAAITVLTNQDAARAAAVIARRVAGIVVGITAAGIEDAHVRRVIDILNSLAQGQIDQSLLNDNAKSYFSPGVLHDYAESLSPMGPPLAARERSHEDRGGMVFRSFDVTYTGKDVTVTTYEMPNGTLDQFLIVP